MVPHTHTHRDTRTHTILHMKELNDKNDMCIDRDWPSFCCDVMLWMRISTLVTITDELEQVEKPEGRRICPKSKWKKVFAIAKVDDQ